MNSRDIHGLIVAAKWDKSKLESDRQEAIQLFIKERMEEPLEAYLRAFESILASVETLMDESVDLSLLRQNAREVLQNKEALKVFRHLSGPPISEDDLRTLVGQKSLDPRRLTVDLDILSRLVSTIMDGLDQRRFPWIADQRVPTSEERYAAIVATTALMATQQVSTSRRNEGKKAQEEKVRKALESSGMKLVPPRKISTLRDAPEPGEFYGQECTFGGSKADLVVGLWDRRVMPIECKVSNSAVNSFKRLYHEAAGKAENWHKNFGENQVVPAAILSGVYSLPNLELAQSRGLSVFWAHDLPELTEWIESTRVW